MTGPLWQYQALAQPPPRAVEAPELSWYQPASEPVRPPAFLHPAHPGIHAAPREPTLTQAPPSLSWFAPASEPVREPAKAHPAWMPGRDFALIDVDAITVPDPVRRFLLGAHAARFLLAAGPGTRITTPAGTHTHRRLGAARAMSITSNLTFFRGEDITLDFFMQPPEDITGWNISFKVADTLGGTVQFTRTASIVNGPRGHFRVTIPSSDTSALAVGRYVWDARRTDSGSKTTLADGYLDLKQEVTA
jgi:hypothetical protein